MNNFQLIDVVLPVGSIIPFAGNIGTFKTQASTPQPFVTQPIEAFGWMLCDGSSLRVDEYPELYAALGSLYGTSGSEGETMFNLPDLRGQFLRGVGTDTASTENRVATPGGTTNGVGSTQQDAFQTHQHTYTEPVNTLPGGDGTGYANVNASAYTGVPTNDNSSPTVKVSQQETRPVNTFINYLIKYTYKLPSLQSQP